MAFASDYDRLMECHEQNLKAQHSVAGMDTVAVVTLWDDDTFTTDLFGDGTARENHAAAESYSTAIQKSGKTWYICLVGSDILVGG